MKMFLGNYNPNLTEGGRIALPKRMREQIKKKKVVLTKGFDPCVYVYDLEDWSEEARRQIDNAKKDDDNARIRDLERYFYSSAVEAPIDSQGRFVIPEELQEYAGIKSKTAVLGVGERIEIWEEDTWEKHFDKIAKQINK